MMIIDLAAMQHKIMNTESIDDLHQAQVELTKYAGELKLSLYVSINKLHKCFIEDEIKSVNILLQLISGIEENVWKKIVKKSKMFVRAAYFVIEINEMLRLEKLSKNKSAWIVTMNDKM